MKMSWIYENCVFGTLNESGEKYAIKQHLESSEIMPHGYDMLYNAEAWFVRIGAWGKLNLYYKKPTTMIGGIFTGRSKITQNEFLKILRDVNMCRLFGTWMAVKDSDTKMHYEREFIDVDEKRKKEFLFVEIDLRPELKNAFK